MKRVKIVFIFLLFVFLLSVSKIKGESSSLYNSIINPFTDKNYSSGFLSYNKFNMKHLFMFSSVLGNSGNLYSGIYLNSLEYKISSSLTSILHLGERINYFSGKEREKGKEFIYGGTLFYKPDKSFEMKIEYGTTEDSVQNGFNFYPSQRMNVWLSKKFGKSTSLFISVQYYNFNK